MDPALRGFVASRDPASGIEDETLSPAAQWAALGRIACPTLVVRGAASDILSPDTAEKMAEEVLGSGRLAVVPRAGHSVMTDNPEGFLEAVSAFLLADG